MQEVSERSRRERRHRTRLESLLFDTKFEDCSKKTRKTLQTKESKVLTNKSLIISVVVVGATLIALIANLKLASATRRQLEDDVSESGPLNWAPKAASGEQKTRPNNGENFRNKRSPDSAETAPSGGGFKHRASSARAAHSAIKNVTAQNGQSVLLHCSVEPSSAESGVSWLRGTGEPQLLTYDTTTIIEDERFVVRKNLAKADDWALQIKNLDKNTDSGLYQCQSSAEPAQTIFYQLTVVEPQVHILGAPDLAVKLGASINLTCVISQSPDQLQYVFWYRDERMINYDIGERGKLVTSKWAGKPDTYSSNLLIHSARRADSANYTCLPSGAKSSSIQVHVLEGLDKRLIMFQNDFSDSLADRQAASSQQTNSAAATARLSRGRAYAMLAALVVVQSWFQLVAQTQTCVSLFLLAIIGYFLALVSDEPSTSRPPTRRASDDSDSLSKFQLAKKSQQLDPQSPQARFSKHETSLDTKLAGRSWRNVSQAHSPDCSSDCDDSNFESSPLRADSACGLIRATAAGDNNNNKSGQQQHQQPLQSPTASTNSTGYNSDHTRTSPSLKTTRDEGTPLRLASPRDRNVASSSLSSLTNQNDDTAMIELLSEPSALALAMDRLTGPRTDEQLSDSLKLNQSPPESYYSIPAGQQAPLKQIIIPCRPHTPSNSSTASSSADLQNTPSGLQNTSGAVCDAPG